MNKLYKDAPFYRGNLHTHTKLSDGRRTPEEAVELYRQNGYDFIAITDHNKTYPNREMGDFTVLGGIELDWTDAEKNKTFHVIGFGLENAIEKVPGELPWDIQKRIVENGGLAMLGHPLWSMMDVSDLWEMDHCFATEIYSGVSEGYSGRGDSSAYVDAAAARGCCKMLAGVDDVHFYDRDFMHAWVMVQADSLKREDLMQALREGRFYASQGPRFVQVQWEGDQMTVQCEPCRRIAFFSNVYYTADRIALAPEGETICQASYKIKPGDKWIRVELMDDQGRRATTQYIAVNQE